MYALSNETALSYAREVQSSVKKAEVPVNALPSKFDAKKAGNKKRKPACCHCGSIRHNGDACFHKEATCYGCKLKGHISTVVSCTEIPEET